LFLSVNAFGQGDQNGVIKTKLIQAIKLTDVDKDKRPLIILDGTPFSHDINGLNANEISAIKILNVSAAQAIYADQGKNGAIIITSKAYYIFHLENELSIKFKRYRELSRQLKYHSQYTINNALISGDRYEVAKHIFDIPENDIVKLNIKKIHNSGIDSVVVDLKTK